MYRISMILVVMMLAGLFQGVAVAASQTTDPPSDYENDPERQVIAQMEELVFGVLDVNQSFWRYKFSQWDYPPPMVGYMTLEPGESHTMACTTRGTNQRTVVTGETNNAYHCASDDWTDSQGNTQYGMIYVPLMPMALFADGNMYGHAVPKDSGVYLIPAILSHEYAHHVVFEMSMITTVQPPDNPESELIADCLAGRVLRLFDLIGGLTPDQVSAIVLGFGMIGDDNADVDSHGTESERQHAFNIGYYGGEDSELECLNTYWPALMAA